MQERRGRPRERQAPERRARAHLLSIAPLCGNSARGGLHHQADLTAFKTPAVNAWFQPRSKSLGSVYSFLNEEVKTNIGKLNRLVERHFSIARDLWNKRTPGGISDAAFAKAVRYAKVCQMTVGGVPCVRVAKDVTHEAFNNAVENAGFFGQHSGSGPRLQCDIVKTSVGEDSARLIMGPFVDLWGLSLKHWDIILAIVTLCRILILWSPLVVVSQSAQASTLLQSDQLIRIKWKSSLAETVEAADANVAISGA